MARRASAAADVRMSSLAAMARALGRSHPLLRLLEIAAEEARDALSAASVSISRLEAGTTTIRTVINVGDLGPCERRWPDDEVYTIHPGSNLGLVVDDLETWTADVTDPHCPPFELGLLEGLGKGSALAAPIMVDGQLWGEFYATRQLGAEPFSDSESAYLQALVAILAGAVSRSAREASLEQLAFRDPLTGLLNRRSLDEQATKAFDLAPGDTRDVTVVVVDINRLKQVNDSQGHSAGDRLIQAVGQAMLEQFGRLTGSLVARVGGDEFIILVSGHDPAEVIAAADRAQYDAKRRGLRHTVVSRET